MSYKVRYQKLIDEYTRLQEELLEVQKEYNDTKEKLRDTKIFNQNGSDYCYYDVVCYLLTEQWNAFQNRIAYYGGQITQRAIKAKESGKNYKALVTDNATETVEGTQQDDTQQQNITA